MAITSATRINKRAALLHKLGLDPKTATAKTISTALKNMFKNLTKLEAYVCKAAAKGQDAGLCGAVELYDGQAVDHVTMADVAKLQRAYKKLLGESLDLIRIGRSNLNIRSVAHMPRAITAKAVMFLQANGYGNLVQRVKYTYKDKDDGSYKVIEADAISSALFKLIPHAINRKEKAVIPEWEDETGKHKATIIDINKAHYGEIFGEEIRRLQGPNPTVRTMAGETLQISNQYITLPMLQALFASQMPKPNVVSNDPEIQQLAQFNKHIPSARLIKKVKATGKELYSILQRGHQISLPKGAAREVSFEQFEQKYNELQAKAGSSDPNAPSPELLTTMFEIITLKKDVEPIVEFMYDEWMKLTLKSREESDAKRRAARSNQQVKNVNQLSDFERAMNFLQPNFAGIDPNQSAQGLVAALYQGH